MSHYPELDNHVRDKVKVVLDLLSHSTKKKKRIGIGIDISDLTAKKYFIALKAEVDKLNINKMTNLSTGLNKLKNKVDDLDVGELKMVSVKK